MALEQKKISACPATELISRSDFMKKVALAGVGIPLLGTLSCKDSSNVNEPEEEEQEEEQDEQEGQEITDKVEQKLEYVLQINDTNVTDQTAKTIEEEFELVISYLEKIIPGRRFIPTRKELTKEFLIKVNFDPLTIGFEAGVSGSRREVVPTLESGVNTFAQAAGVSIHPSILSIKPEKRLRLASIMHEIFHGMGYSILFDVVGNNFVSPPIPAHELLNEEGHFIGEEALNIFCVEFNVPDAKFIPLDDTQHNTEDDNPKNNDGVPWGQSLLSSVFNPGEIPVLTKTELTIMRTLGFAIDTKNIEEFNKFLADTN